MTFTLHSYLSATSVKFPAGFDPRLSWKCYTLLLVQLLALAEFYEIFMLCETNERVKVWEITFARTTAGSLLKRHQSSWVLAVFGPAAAHQSCWTLFLQTEAVQKHLQQVTWSFSWPHFKLPRISAFVRMFELDFKIQLPFIKNIW